MTEQENKSRGVFLKIIRIKPLSAFSTNSYLVVSEKNNAVLIDAPDDAEYILEYAKQNNCVIKKILLTHGHCDHIAAASDIQNISGCEVCIHKDDATKLSSPVGNLTAFFGLPAVERVRNVTEIRDGDKISLDEMTFEVLHTPGHTSGSVCYLIDDTMFSGDTLFNLSIGRTDMPDGSYKALVESLRKLCALEKNYTVYSGHMDMTTLDFEKKNNPYLY